MVAALGLLGVLIGILGVVLSYFFYLHSTKPTATEIASELRESLYTTDSKFIGTKHHALNVTTVNVSSSTSWIEERNDTNQQYGYVLLKGLFIGEAEIIQRIETPDSIPDIDKIRTHPYYGESIEYGNSNTGTVDFQITQSGQTLILSVDFYAESIREGAAIIIRTLQIMSDIIDDIIKKESDGFEEIPPFEEYMSDGEFREDIGDPIVPLNVIRRS